MARSKPTFAAVLRAYRQVVLAGNDAEAETERLIAWPGGQPNVAAGIKGD